MPYEGIGARHTAVATKVCKHGDIVVEDKIVGTAFKVEQLGRFVDPLTAAATQIDVGEEFEIQVGGVHEADAAGAVAAAAVGDLIWIDPTDNSLEVAAAAASGFLPVGTVTEVDTARTPDKLRINSNALAGFLAA